MADEIVDIVDEQGQVLRRASKHDAHRHGWLHATVIGYLYDDQGNWILVQQAPDRQDGGQWVGLVGGHVQSGETHEQAMRREILEEAGARDVTLKPIGQRRFHRQVVGRDENHLFVIYEFNTPDTITLNHEGVAIRTFPMDEVKRIIVEEPDTFGDALHFVVEAFYPHLLPRNWPPRFAKC